MSERSTTQEPEGRVLRDAFGRHLSYLRLSVTDRCNFKCAYCLPQGCEREERERPLALDEVRRLARAFAALGLWKIRLTGGEPTLRPDVVDLVAAVAATPGVRRVGITTNGYRLAAIAAPLRAAGLTALNVSLDSLDPERFAALTGAPLLERVVAGVEAAVAAGVPHVKVNAVLLRGLPDADLDRFLSWTRAMPISVRFIELMETADNRDYFARNHLPAAALEEKLRARGWTPLAKGPGDGPALLHAHAGHVGTVGVIAPYAQGFCEGCNRLRVSAAGDLKLCLFGDQQVPLRPLLQADGQHEELVQCIEAAVARKPASHQLVNHRFGSVGSLASTGG